MLTELFVKNIAIVDEIRLSFGRGMTVLTGETGAGKSILVESIGLVIGGKASPQMIRSGEKEGVIEAVFSLEGKREARMLLKEWGLVDDEQVIVRRHLQSEGKNKIYLNGKASSLSQLSALGPQLIDLVSQNDQQILLNEENHIAILDEGSDREGLSAYREMYGIFQQLREEHEALKRAGNNRVERVEFLRFQVAEIDKARIVDPDEEQKLVEERGRARNATLLREIALEGEAGLVSGEGAVVDLLDRLTGQLKKGIEVDPSLSTAAELICQAHEPLAEAGRFFSRYQESLTADPARLEEIESRLYLIHQLKKKHGTTLAEVLERAEKLRSELRLLENHDDTLAKKRAEVEKMGKRLLDLAQRISDSRKAEAKKLEQKITKELKELSLPRAQYRIQVTTPSTPSPSDLGPDGFDSVRFDFSANAGEEPRPLSAIASGGELSRILLGIKTAVCVRSEPVTSIFDEVDSGIGGAVAEVVGKKLKSLSQKGQVLSVTHLPQIASLADCQMVIEKRVLEKRTRVSAKVLSTAREREEEIARMLGGVTVTDKTRAHAKEMLERGREHPLT